MIERRGGARFSNESLDSVGVKNATPRQELHHEIATQLGVARVIELAHSACAQERNDLIPSDW
jgi:hypothetical protein